MKFYHKLLEAQGVKNRRTAATEEGVSEGTGGH